MRKIPRFFLWLISLLVPVFIAACYGPPQGYRAGGEVGSRPDRQGRVVDADSEQGLANIDVLCLNRVGKVLFRTATDGQGRFRVPGHLPCVEFQFGDGQHARYKPTTRLATDARQFELEPAD